jgi:hypothetical protein
MKILSAVAVIAFALGMASWPACRAEDVETRARAHVEAMQALMTGPKDVATLGECILALAEALNHNGQWQARFPRATCLSIIEMSSLILKSMAEDADRMRAEAKGAK